VASVVIAPGNTFNYAVLRRVSPADPAQPGVLDARVFLLPASAGGPHTFHSA
jgi:hypothetical protein